MFHENPFLAIWHRLDQIEAIQTEMLHFLRNTASNMSPVDESPISTEQAAKMFGIAKQTLYQNSRKIKHTKRFGRLYWYPSELRAYLNGGKVAL